MAVLALYGFAGCRAEPDGWIPVLEQTSTTFLQRQTERALETTRAAQGMLPGEPRRAMSMLDDAGSMLEELLHFYLPLFEARELTYNAYREFYLGRPGQSIDRLNEVESILREMAWRDERYYRAVQEPLGHVEKSRLALESGSPEARQTLSALASELNFLVLKGDLVLSEG